MKLVLIIIGLIAIACIALEIVGKILAKRSRGRFDKLSPEEQRKAQEAAYRQQAYSNS